MATQRRFEPGSKIMSMSELQTLVDLARYTGRADQLFFYMHDGPDARPKYWSFITSMPFRVVSDMIKAGRLYVARPRAKEAHDHA